MRFLLDILTSWKNLSKKTGDKILWIIRITIPFCILLTMSGCTGVDVHEWIGRGFLGDNTLTNKQQIQDSHNIQGIEGKYILYLLIINDILIIGGMYLLSKRVYKLLQQDESNDKAVINKLIHIIQTRK